MDMSLDEIKEKTQQLATKSGLKEETVEKLFTKFYNDLLDQGLSNENAEKRALLRVQASLKRKRVGLASVKTTPGFYMSRGKWFDNSKKPRNTAKDYIEKYGLEKAIEAGYADVDGNYLYNDYDNRKGKIIPDVDPKAVGLAMLEIDGVAKPAQVNYKGEAATEPIELFKIGDLPNYMRNNGEKSCEITCSRLPAAYNDDHVNFPDYLDKVKKGFPASVLSNLKKSEDFYLEHGDEFGSWCLFEANVLKISSTKKGNTAVEVDDVSLSLDEDGDEIPSMTIFFPKGFDIDFREDAIGVTFVASPFLNDNGEIMFSGLGYWVDPVDRVNKEDFEDVDPEEGW